MKDRNGRKHNPWPGFSRQKKWPEAEVFCADPSQGLNPEQIRRREEAGWVSGRGKPAGKSVWEILLLHILTFLTWYL